MTDILNSKEIFGGSEYLIHYLRDKVVTSDMIITQTKIRDTLQTLSDDFEKYSLEEFKQTLTALLSDADALLKSLSS